MHVAYSEAHIVEIAGINFAKASWFFMEKLGIVGVWCHT